MIIKRGKSRLVFIFPKLGIVIKFPILHLSRIPRMIKQRFNDGGWKFFWKTFKHEFNYYKSNTAGSFKREIFLGLIANWNEFYLYWKTRSLFLQPTYFSFFGFLNIQKCGEPCKLKDKDLWCQFCILTDRKVWDDSHHFSSSKNFSFDKGKLRMIDYGSYTVNNVVILYGEKIFNSFNPDFCWEEEKRKRMGQKATI